MTDAATATTSGRLLGLLSLLQTPREWPGPELARRLAVSTRTVRNDVERLRRLGYPVLATRGSVGGYRLAAGTAMPPLVLDDDEAVAVALALRTSTAGGVEGIEETSLRALTKLQQVLPKRLAARVDALQSYTQRASPYRPRGGVDSRVLGALAAHARDHEVVRFAYSDRDGAATERRVEPYRVVAIGRRWYLVGFDVGREDWRMFRLDRLSDLHGVAHPFRDRPLPASDLGEWAAAKTRTAHRFRATVVVEAAPRDIALGPWAEGGVEDLGDDRSRLTLGSDSATDLARQLAFLDADFHVEDSPVLREAVATVGARMMRAAGAAGSPPT